MGRRPGVVRRSKIQVVTDSDPLPFETSLAHSPPFEARPLPRFAFTNARRAASALRKKAVALLGSSSLDEQAALEWGLWAKAAQASIMRGYNLMWKMPSPTPKSISEFLRNEVPYTPGPEEVSVGDFLKKVNK